MLDNNKLRGLETQTCTLLRGDDSDGIFMIIKQLIGLRQVPFSSPASKIGSMLQFFDIGPVGQYNVRPFLTDIVFWIGKLLDD